jgi:plastocyanin
MDEASPSSGATSSEAGVKEFTVSGSNFKFEPASLKVNKGDKVKITFKNTGGFHDFVIDELDVATKQIQSGQEEVVEFTADEVGMFEYYCSVGNHRAQGMKGTLTVQ